MNKTKLVEAISSDCNISKTESREAINAFIASASKALQKGERVALSGFGSFKVSQRKARIGRNPQNGKPIQIKARKFVKFRAARELCSRLR